MPTLTLELLSSGLIIIGKRICHKLQTCGSRGFLNNSKVQLPFNSYVKNLPLPRAADPVLFANLPLPRAADPVLFANHPLPHAADPVLFANHPLPHAADPVLFANHALPHI
jgi:hypothetical protein